MPIFGQVWLWSLLAFLLGTVLCWVLVVLPVRRRLDALERRLATIRAETKLSAASSERPQPAAAAPARPAGMVPGFGEQDSQDEIRAESLTRAYAMPGILDAPVESPTEDPEERGALRLSSDPEPPAAATEYMGALGSPLVSPRQPADPRSAGAHGWFEDDRDREPALPAHRADHHLVDDSDQDDDEDRGTIFTQRTMPIPAELIRQVDEAGTVAASATPHDDSLVDDLDDEPEDAQVVQEESAQPAFSGADTVVVHKNGALPTEVQPAPEPEPVAQEQPEERTALVSKTSTGRTPIIELNKPLDLASQMAAHSVTVESERTQNALPKRVPAKPQHRHPFGVQTVSPAMSTPVAVDTTNERMRSLFEPVIPAESTGGQQEDVLPPPHRLHTTDSSRPSAPGPFGPGSAMPLPGGASPSPEFTIKASVTALRYCTPESPQFGKTVAEVWFRSAADAERVGFRPVG